MTRPFTAFLDRDGVINEKPFEGRYVTSWEEFRFLPGAIGALRDLRAAGVRLIVVTNQRGIARGLVSREAVDEIHGRMNAVLAESGAAVDAIYVCPHEAGTCDCRKPAPGMFLRAREQFPDIEFEHAAVIGDSLTDLAPGAGLGALTFLIADSEAVTAIRGAAVRQGVRIDGWAASLAELVWSGTLPLLVGRT